ncbi:MAG: anthranilate synthase component I family protein [Candidatus Zixiibacteriota bacterium]
MTRERYERDVLAVKHHLREGDIYQANYTCRWEVTSNEPASSVYRQLRELNPSPYGAYLNFGDYQILSSSPERMLHRVGNRISTSPIKGTVARGENAVEDSSNLKQLLASEKDRAEHLMIVDLERNDLGKIALPGTVRVTRLCRPETYANLFHLVSDISATLPKNITLGTVLKALLPGGSITGAPKLRAVEILRELEPVPRSVYTGCIGYISPEVIEFNIAIRTMVHQNGLYRAYAGGGIVADSEPAAEYQEMLLKAERMMSALGIKNLNDRV